MTGQTAFYNWFVTMLTQQTGFYELFVSLDTILICPVTSIKLMTNQVLLHMNYATYYYCVDNWATD